MARVVRAETKEKYKRVIDAYYSNGLNPYLAYKSVYPNCINTVMGSNRFSALFNSELMQPYIKLKQVKIRKVMEITQESFLKELIRIKDADLTQFVSLTKDELINLPTYLKKMISKIDPIVTKDTDGSSAVTDYKVSIEKSKILEMIAKHIGFYEKDNTQQNQSIEIVVGDITHKDAIEALMGED